MTPSHASEPFTEPNNMNITHIYRKVMEFIQLCMVYRLHLTLHLIVEKNNHIRCGRK